jgi:hypothetical protein
MTEMLNKARLVVRLADGTTIRGAINIGKYNRLSDFLNSRDSDPFIIVYEAALPDTDGKVVIINRHHIAWAMPE